MQRLTLSKKQPSTDELITLARQKGFVYPACEIYRGNTTHVLHIYTYEENLPSEDIRSYQKKKIELVVLLFVVLCCVVLCSVFS